MRGGCGAGHSWGLCAGCLGLCAWLLGQWLLAYLTVRQLGLNSESDLNHVTALCVPFKSGRVCLEKGVKIIWFGSAKSLP